MAEPRLTRSEAALVAELGLEFSEPPQNVITRRSKFADHYTAVKNLARKFPGRYIKMYTWDQPSQPYALAKAINNGERREFAVDDTAGNYVAYATKIEAHESVEDGVEVDVPVTYGIWIKFVESVDEEDNQTETE